MIPHLTRVAATPDASPLQGRGHDTILQKDFREFLQKYPSISVMAQEGSEICSSLSPFCLSEMPSDSRYHTTATCHSGGEDSALLPEPKINFLMASTRNCCICISSPGQIEESLASI